MPAQESFARAVFSGPDGAGSVSRVNTFLLVVFPLMWITYLVLRTGKLPDLTGITAFISATSLSNYGVNKALAAFQNRKGKQPCP